MAKRKRSPQHGEQAEQLDEPPAKKRDTSSTKVSTNSDLTLLGIPPELRNHIYRYALIEQSGVHLSAQEHLQPALLRTCRQMRKEASGIFYHENTFRLDIVDLNMELPIQHWAMTEVFRKHPKSLWVKTCGKAHWGNLKQWLRKYHADQAFGIGENARDSVEVQAAAHACGIVDKMVDVPWATVEAVLEEYRKGTELLSNVWART